MAMAEQYKRYIVRFELNLKKNVSRSVSSMEKTPLVCEGKPEKLGLHAQLYVSRNASL